MQNMISMREVSRFESVTGVCTKLIYPLAVINIFVETTRGISPPFGSPKGGNFFGKIPKDLVVIPILVAKHLVVISILGEKRLWRPFCRTRTLLRMFLMPDFYLQFTQ